MFICDIRLYAVIYDLTFLFYYAASQTVRKIIEINPYMLGTMAGGAADCQFWHRNLGNKVRSWLPFNYNFSHYTFAGWG